MAETKGIEIGSRLVACSRFTVPFWPVPVLARSHLAVPFLASSRLVRVCFGRFPFGLCPFDLFQSGLSSIGQLQFGPFTCDLCTFLWIPFGQFPFDPFQVVLLIFGLFPLADPRLKTMKNEMTKEITFYFVFR